MRARVPNPKPGQCISPPTQLWLSTWRTKKSSLQSFRHTAKVWSFPLLHVVFKSESQVCVRVQQEKKLGVSIWVPMKKKRAVCTESEVIRNYPAIQALIHQQDWDSQNQHQYEGGQSHWWLSPAAVHSVDKSLLHVGITHWTGEK